MPPPFIMQIEHLSKSYEKKTIIKDISLSFYYGAKIGVLGSNGSGKSTLLRIMAGQDKDFEGSLHHMPNCKIGFVPQEPQLSKDKDVKGCLDEAVHETHELLRKFEEVGAKMEKKLKPAEMEKAMTEMQDLQDKIDACNAWEIDRQLEIAAEALELPPMDAKIAVLSGGEKRRVALCRTLLQSPDLLLLDEPTNHLDAASVAWLERFLKDFKGTVIAVTHDRYFLDNVAGYILELDRGRGIPWQGNYTSWLEQKKKRLELEEKTEEQRQRTLARELEWIRLSPRARQAKPKARIAAYETLLAQDAEDQGNDLEMRIPAGPKLGNHVLEAKNVRKAYGDRVLIDDLNLSLPPGGIIGVIGPNGAGKTTLMRMIMGQEKPDSGTLTLGPTVKLAYVDQNRETLAADKTVYQEISDGQDQFKTGGKWMNCRAYVGKFNFKGTDQQKMVGELSGGERNRVQIAKLLKAGGNLILLDEPSNDLDVDTLRALEEGLLSFVGCAIVVTHDRWFLDRIATHILAFEGDGKVRWFEGNYQAYVAKRREEIGDAAENPHRIKYRKLAQ
ncbi:MAG: energy-dependent translational throttle protein EttA [Planctomycetes bacterium]|nr:energy-dependent translational throttle protein EttA [Planctomycetota bacterium]